MNSNLMNWYFKIFSTNSNVNGYEVNNFPIPNNERREQKSFDEIVDKIFSITIPPHLEASSNCNIGMSDYCNYQYFVSYPEF